MVAGHGTGRAFPGGSNMRWVVALPGETSECVCQGLLEVFERTGMTGVVVFDNATGVGTATPTARLPRPACSPCSARTTGSSPGSATRMCLSN